MNSPASIDDVAAEDSVTGFPGLRSWRTVYTCVLAIFVLYIVLLTLLSRTFQ